MDREQFAERVYALRQEGKSIRTIARELCTYKTKIQRILKNLTENSASGTPAGNKVAGAFVGRQHEMDELRAALEDVVSGRGRIVMLSGEPGIGKTRLAQEIGVIAADNDVQTLWGRCYEGQGAPSYWPWVQIIRDYARGRDSEQLRSEMGAGAPDIAEIVSELKAKLPSLEPPTTLDSPDANRFRLFDSIASFFKSAAQSKPLMLVLEDLHWADKPSLLLLEFLAHEVSGSRILVVGASRHIESEHALSQTIGELAREPYFQQIHLPRLELSDVRQYIQEASGARPPDEYTEAIFSRTEGNPFFMTELVRLLGHDPSTTVQGEHFNRAISIPDSVRGAIIKRLERLSETCTQALTIASVIGKEFGLDVLNLLMSDVSADQLLVELEEATKLRIVDELEGEVGRYQFSHVLIQEAISDELSRSRKVALHTEIGEVLEALHGREIENHAAELARHFAEAAPLTGIDRMVHYSLIAGERALATYAYEDAQTHFERGLAAETGKGVDAERATMLFGLGRAQLATFGRAQAQEAVDTLRSAFDAFTDLGDTPNAVAAATHPHSFLAYSSGTADMAARALDLVPPDSLEAGYLLSHYGPALFWENRDYEGAQENLDRAVEIARRKEDRVLEVRALAVIALMRNVLGHHREAVDQGLLVIELAQSLDELDTLVLARHVCAVALLWMGDVIEAEIHLAAGLDAAERLHNSSWVVQMLRNNTILAILKGEWKDAQEAIARALAESRRSASTLAHGALLNLQVGNLEESSEYINHVLEVLPDVLVGIGFEDAYAAAIIPLFARVTGTTDLLDAAESAAREILSSPSLPNITIMVTRVGLALTAIQRSDAEAAKEQYPFVESRRGTQEGAIMCYDRLLGLLAQTMGNLDDAQTHFEEALTFCRKAGYRTELAWSCYEYAAFRQAQGEYENTLALLDEALAISIELGMRSLREKVIALKANGESQPNARPIYSAGLTAREVEVLLLIAQGKTNREIANELHLSARTVQRHISNLYVKINVRNRVEASAFALNELSITPQPSHST